MIEDTLTRGPAGLDVAAAVRRATERAQAEGAVDITYAEVESPLGPLVAAQTGHGLVRLAYEDRGGGLDVVLGDLADRVSPRIVEAPSKLDGLRRQLDEYFAGQRRDFDVPLDWSLSHGFTQRILRAIWAIPFGETSNYRDVAAAAGKRFLFKLASCWYALRVCYQLIFKNFILFKSIYHISECAVL